MSEPIAPVDLPPNVWTNIFAGLDPGDIPAKFIVQNANDRYGDDILVTVGDGQPADESVHGEKVKALDNVPMEAEPKVWCKPVAGRWARVHIGEVA